MLMTFVAAFVLLCLLVAGMAVGVLFARKPIKGSCGGLSALGMKGDCEVCGGNPDACEDSVPRDAPLARPASTGKKA